MVGVIIHYVTVHILRQIWGNASEHRCEKCGRKAEQWAYQYNSEHELDWKGTVYSADLSCYAPMCRSCHRKFDIQHDERIRDALAKGGVRVGALCGSKKANKTTRSCECGLVSTPGAMGVHQKATNHRLAV